MTPNAMKILEFMKNHYGEEFSKQQIADATGLTVPHVTGTMNSLIKNKYAINTRSEEVVTAKATETRKAVTKTVWYHTLTEMGLKYDPVKEEQEKAALKEAEKARKAAERAAAKAAKTEG
jgi:DNA-binding MarR family transcriptional regulator